MPQPITWRNVDAPSFAASNALLMQGRDKMSGGFDKLTGTLTQYGDQRTKAATDDLLAQLSQSQGIGGRAEVTQQNADNPWVDFQQISDFNQKRGNEEKDRNMEMMEMANKLNIAKIRKVQSGGKGNYPGGNYSEGGYYGGGLNSLTGMTDLPTAEQPIKSEVLEDMLDISNNRDHARLAKDLGGKNVLEGYTKEALKDGTIYVNPNRAWYTGWGQSELMGKDKDNLFGMDNELNDMDTKAFSRLLAASVRTSLKNPNLSKEQRSQKNKDLTILKKYLK